MTTWTAETIERHRWLAAVLLALVVGTVYLPVVNAGYVWDDETYVVNNANLRDSVGLKRIWVDPASSPQYYPLVFTTFWVERQLFGSSPASHHLVNIALHVANAWLLWLVLRCLDVPAALLIALVFAIHPVHVESVAWITERKNVLSAFFYLSALLAYLSFAFPRATGSAAASPQHGAWARSPATSVRLLYVLSLLLFLCALFSKTVTSTLPAVLLLLLWWKRARVEWGDIAPLVPMAAIGAAFGGLTTWIEAHQVGAMGDEWALSSIGRFLLAGRVVSFYAVKLLWPRPLVFNYPRWTIAAATWWQYLFPFGVVAAVGVVWYLRNRVGRGPLVAVLAFIGSLFPVLGFLNVYPMRFSYVADHFQYLPSIAFIALTIVAGRALLGRLRLEKLAVPIAASVVLALGVMARAETRKFHDLETLWQDTIAKNPDSWIAYNNRGNLRMNEGRWLDAARDFQRAISVKPDLAEAHNHLGLALLRAGDTPRAVGCFRMAILWNPRDGEALNNLGVAVASLGQPEEAVGYFRRAIDLQSDSARAHYNLANALGVLGQEEAAEFEYRAAIRLEPRHAMAYYSLGVRLLARGKRKEAAPVLAEAFRLKPDFAAGYYQVGNVLLQQGDAAAAIDSYARAIGQKPDYAEAYLNLGVGLMQQGKVVEAIANFREATRLKPGSALAENTLASALERQGQLEEALSHYEAAARFDPASVSARENMARLRHALAKR